MSAIARVRVGVVLLVVLAGVVLPVAATVAAIAGMQLPRSWEDLLASAGGAVSWLRVTVVGALALALFRSRD